MTRRIEYSAPLSVFLGPVERAIVGYYGHRFGISKGAVIRGLIRTVCESDKAVDPEELLDFARQDLPRIERLDADVANGVAEAVESYTLNHAKSCQPEP